jgi:hypothetical protein
MGWAGPQETNLPSSGGWTLEQFPGISQPVATGITIVTALLILFNGHSHL